MSQTLRTGLEDGELLLLAHNSLADAEASAEVAALRAEWDLMCLERGMPSGIEFDARRGRQAEPIYSVSAPNGRHESRLSFAHAFELLVDSHRTRVEDLPETHALVMQLTGETLKGARAICAKLAAGVRADAPNMPGPERDALVLAAIHDLPR